jgi:hypothetical protein
MEQRGRLLDEFQAELARHGLGMPGELREIGLCLDVFWPPCGDGQYVMSRVTIDPSFIIIGHTRYVAMSWVLDEIRFLATRITPGEPPWWWTGEDPARVAAVNADEDELEMGIFESIADAVAFTVSYLGGTRLADVRVQRIRPTPERYQGRASPGGT